MVMDQLNTHSPASLYEAFAPDKAQRLADCLEIYYIPQAWFLAEQGRDRVERADATGPSASATVPLWNSRSVPGSSVAIAGIKADRQFTTTEARIKLC
jgi:hypothetical protein